MAFTLPELPYEYNALEPYIDELTMTIHHTKHHQAYVTNLSNALEGHDTFLSMSIEELVQNLKDVPDTIRTTVRNNGGGHFNHSFFWQLLTPHTNQPSNELMGLIDTSFGSFDKFKEEFAKAALGRFGSGWAWLVLEKDTLSIETTPNQDNPLMDGKKPVLGLDVWEHAYYLKYQNKRADYINAFWNIVNWQQVVENIHN